MMLEIITGRINREMREDPLYNENILEVDTTHGHEYYYELIAKMAELHSRKNRDYGGGNPLGNFLHARSLGVDPFTGILVRLSDKWSRICSLVRTNERHVKDESIEDTLLDLANYALLALVLLKHGDDDGK